MIKSPIQSCYDVAILQKRDSNNEGAAVTSFIVMRGYTSGSQPVTYQIKTVA